MRLILFALLCFALSSMAQTVVEAQNAGAPSQVTPNPAQYAPAGAGIGGVSPSGEPMTLFDSRDRFALLQFKDSRLSIDQPGQNKNNFYSMLINCQRTLRVGPTGVGSQNCLTVNSTDFGPGVNFGNNGLGNQGWTVSGAFLINKTSYTRGITQGLTIDHRANKIGDSAGIYIYHYCKGGFLASSDEGCEPLKIDGGESATAFGGRVERGGRGAVEVAIRATQDNDGACDGCTLIDMREPVAHGNIVGSTNPAGGTPGTLTSDTAVTPSTGAGTTMKKIDVVPNGQEGTLASVVVDVTHGSFAKSETIVFGCDNFYDEVRPESVSEPLARMQTITARFRFSHPAGCPVMQGGTQGYLDLTAERRSPSGGNLLRTSYPIIGATDAHTLVYRIYLAGTQANGLYAGGHHFGVTLPFARLRRTHGVVHACGDFGGVGGNLLPMAGQTIQVAEATDPGFDGTFTPAKVVDGGACLTWPQARMDATSEKAKVSMGGAVGGLGGYAVWPGAEVTGVGIANSHLNGTLRLAPNHVNWAREDFVEQPHPTSVVVQGVGLDLQWNSPVTNAEDLGINLSMAGVGVSANAAPLLIENRNDWTMYRGYGGHLEPAQMGRFRGVWRGYFQFDQPSPQGALFEVYRGKGGCKDPGLDQYGLWRLETAGPAASAEFDCARGVLTTRVAGSTLTQDGDGVHVNNLIVEQKTPTAKTQCKAGQMWSDATYLYVCTAENVVKGVKLMDLH